MKEIRLHNGMITLVDDEDFERCSGFTWSAMRGDSVRENWYAITRIGKKTTYMHRFILNAPDGKWIDHRDGNGLNNVRANIRFATRSQNNANRVYPSKSGFRGVHEGWPNHYRAQIECAGTIRRIGTFSNPVDAARAYDRAAIELFGEFAILNFPERA